MQVRREQGLLIAVVLLGALVWYNRESDPPKIAVRPQIQEYAVEAPPPTALLDASAVAAENSRRDLFREPSESVPLPPCTLDEPPATALPVVWLPLVPGQHALAFAGLRGPGEVKEPVAFDPGAGAGLDGNGAPGNGAPAPAPGPGAQAGGREEWERTYDLVETTKGDQWWGEILNANKVRLARGIVDVKVLMRWISPDTGRVVRESLEIDPGEIKAVHLAKTLRNEVGLRELDVTKEVANLPVRAELIEWLLQQATREGWAYEKALELAHGYAAIAPNKIEGLRVVARVLRAAGRLTDEWQLFQTLPADLADSSFRWAGQGAIEALLGLDAAAEPHLRQAVARGTDPWAAIALTDFLLTRGRTEEAVPVARLAYKDRGMLRHADDQFALRRTLIAAYLAAGLLQEAREVASNLPTANTALRGAVAYAAGDIEFAAGQFRAAIESNDMPGLAALGSAACAARAGKWQEAKAQFEGLADRDPMLRARALGGVALVLERTGNFDAAAAQLADALTVDPTDAYLAYLRGRALRLAGDFDGAAEQLAQALRRRDDLVEAMAEMAEADLRIAERDERRAAESLVHAMRYIDRCVALDQQLNGKPLPRFLELKGLVHWRAGDPRVARQAFAAAQEAGSTYGQVGVALIDYAQGRTETARDQLSDLDKRPLNDPFRDFGKATLAKINDHAEKVEIRDDFERDELGGRWDVTFTAGRQALRPTIDQGQMRMRGKVENQETAARRVIESAGDFVAAEVMLERGVRDEASFEGLRLLVGRDARKPDLQAKIGFANLADGVVPALQIWDGSADQATTDEDKAKFEWRPLVIEASDGPHRLAFEFVPDGEGFLLRATWNDAVVAEQKLTRIRRTARQPMQVDLVVDGKHGQVDVSFDRFRLRQRQR